MWTSMCVGSIIKYALRVGTMSLSLSGAPSAPGPGLSSMTGVLKAVLGDASGDTLCSHALGMRTGFCWLPGCFTLSPLTLSKSWSIQKQRSTATKWTNEVDKWQLNSAHKEPPHRHSLCPLFSTVLLLPFRDRHRLELNIPARISRKDRAAGRRRQGKGFSAVKTDCSGFLGLLSP